MKIYPLQFDPILKERIWGGTKLKTEFNKKNQVMDFFTNSNLFQSIKSKRRDKLKTSSIHILVK